MTEPTEEQQEVRVGPPFSVVRWTKEHLTRESGSMVDRLALLAVGVLHGTEDRYVTTEQIESLTGLDADLVTGVLVDAEERGEVRRNRSKYWPVQKPFELDRVTTERRKLERSIVCETCASFVGDECTTAKGVESWTVHAPRRLHANQVTRQAAA